MNDNKRIAINSVVIFLRLCIVSMVNIIASRVVLDALGASDFGQIGRASCRERV